MTVHIVKLSAGTKSLEERMEWQRHYLAYLKKAGRKPELVHVTKMMPKRAEEILEGGSIYWVIKGFIVARQKIIELRPIEIEGISRCAIIYEEKMVHVRMTPRRAFQGWRYLEAQDAPPDTVQGDQTDEMPESLKRELAALGLL